jgi:hypothetical protein
MLLADVPAAAARFLPYAAMSALAYAEDTDCGDRERKLSKDERATLEKYLSESHWYEIRKAEWAPPCEDDVGLFYRVWKNEIGDSVQIVIAFRGTWGTTDWLYGNLHWFTRFLPIEDQYGNARKHVQRVLDHFANDVAGSPSNKPLHVYTTGHSLGGGLAQHVLYSFPTTVIQAFAFNPSAATGFVEQTAENQTAACKCDLKELNGEARIYRIYDAYEILANLRIFHKIIFDPERHIQEVRFQNETTHSMKELAFFLLREARRKSESEYVKPWYSGVGHLSNASESCTMAFVKGQQRSCSVKVSPDSWDRCPQ